ncbi:helix-turn-helix domain-containing protein [Streptomyces morookaense]|uniref:Uncharacterized protein n=1 Tax=Streptomyces morookaense TaxID=1970 RepID=A0A7Y7B748_STRMO|nr:helix-turn-helix domain-containing protein [Streptomyces morookaense]NVK80255.1 hypothetical protein [Streptomyces morookaense]
MQHLEVAEDRLEPLTTRLALAEQITCAIRWYAGAAVHGARLAGASWQDISVATGTSEASARARWNAPRLTRDLAEFRASAQDELTVGERTDAGETVRRPTPQALIRPRALGEAFAVLRERSGVTVHDTARQADLALDELCRILDGDFAPSWPVTHMLTTILGGNPEETRIVWEAVHGMRRASRLSSRDAGTKLQQALRGLHLAAGCPPPEALGRSSGLPAVVVTDILSGAHLPDWRTTASLVSGLAADPEVVRGLWEDLDYARIASSSDADVDSGPAC